MDSEYQMNRKRSAGEGSKIYANFTGERKLE